jgi:hypothetical protein
VVSLRPRPPYPGAQSLRNPLNRRLGGFQSQPGRCEIHKISCPCRESNAGRPVRSPSLYLSQLHTNHVGIVIKQQRTHSSHVTIYLFHSCRLYVTRSYPIRTIVTVKRRKMVASNILLKFPERLLEDPDLLGK